MGAAAPGRWMAGALLLGTTLLLGACGKAAHAPPAGGLQDVRAIEIRYQYSGGERMEEVHRLQPAAGRRRFRRVSQLDVQGSGPVLTDDVPAQRVAELLWTLSAPARPRAQGVDEVARRVRPAQLLKQASFDGAPPVPGCTPAELRRQMRMRVRGAPLRDQLERYYASAMAADELVSIRVVIDYESAPEQVVSSRTPALLMLPWVLGEADATAAPRTWSVPISQALRRVLPATSQAYVRLGQREDAALARQLGASAAAACRAPPH